MNSNYEMPYSFIFTDEELCDLWSYYRRISQIIHNVEMRHSLCITDAEAHAGAYFRARALLAEAQRRETLHGNDPRLAPCSTQATLSIFACRRLAHVG